MMHTGNAHWGGALAYRPRHVAPCPNERGDDDKSGTTERRCLPLPAALDAERQPSTM